MNTPLPLDAAALDRIESGELGVGPSIGDRLIAQSRAALTLAARVAELEAACDDEAASNDSLRRMYLEQAAHANALRDALVTTRDCCICGTCCDAMDAALAAQAQEVKRTEERWECPTCGLGVAADEDGCCATCGADCKTTQATVTIKAQEVKP